MDRCRWLVTGGAGFIGSNIVAALARRGERVRALDNLKTGRWSNLDAIEGAHLVERETADVRDPDAVQRACDGVEVIFHQAALCSVPESLARPIEYDRVNVGGTVVVLDCARRAGVRRVVLASSAAVYGNEPTIPKLEQMRPAPLSPYALGKHVGELQLQLAAVAWGLEAVSLRYFNVFGPNQLPTGPYAAAIPRFIDAIVRGRPIEVFGDGEQTRDFCYIDDVVRANIAAAQTDRCKSGEVINIAGGRSVSINKLLQRLKSSMEQDFAVNYGPTRAGDVRDSLADIGRARELLGWEPQVGWEQGLGPTAAFLRAEMRREAQP
jgi:UDP-glucose 4-epimerase